MSGEGVRLTNLESILEADVIGNEVEAMRKGAYITTLADYASVTSAEEALVNDNFTGLKERIDVAKRAALNHTQQEPNSINWLGICPREQWWSAEDVLKGEVQCAEIHDSVVYLHRTTKLNGPSAVFDGRDAIGKPFKVTTWTHGRMMHRAVFATIEEARENFAQQRVEVARALAVKVLTNE